MKKLRVALIVLFAMLMSLALFACNNTGDSGGGTGTGDEKNPAGQVDTLTVDGKIEFHDQQKKAEAEALLANVKITATYENDAEGNPVASKVLTKDDYTADWSGVPFGTDGTVNVGNYKLTVTPKADNFYKVTATVEVVVSHNFQKNGELTSCPKDGATVVEQDITDTFKIEGWNTTVTLGKDNKVISFADGHINKMTTVGRLEKGMSISLTGFAHTLSTGNTYYFPILGVANVEEGGSFLQRGDNWGIYTNAELPAWNRNPFTDQDSVTTGFPGLEAAELMRGYVNGPVTEAVNYIYDEASKEAETVGVDTYKTYWDDVTAETPFRKITITWSYSVDCVFEITYEVAGIGTRTISIKLPDRQFYHALLYGEQVEMKFTHATTIQSLKLKDAETPEIKEVKVLENKMLSDYYDQFDFGVTYEGNQSGKVNKDMLTVYGSETENVAAKDVEALKTNPTADAIEKAGWVNLATNKMSKNYKSFFVVVTVGPDSIGQLLSNPGDITIVENAVDHASPNEVTIGSTQFITGVSGVEFVTLDAKPTLVVSGYALTLTADQKAALKQGTTATHSVAFTVYQNGATVFNGTPAFTGADGYVHINEDGKSMDVVLGITKDTKTVTITGVQPTPIVVNFTQAAVDTAGNSYTQDTVAGRTITSSMQASYEQKLNESQKVTIVYNIGDRASSLNNADLRAEFKFVVNNSTTYFNAAGNAADNGDRIEANKKLMKGIEGMTVDTLTFDKTAKTITVVYNVPAFDPAAPVSYQFSLLDRKNGDATLVVDYLYYVPEFSANNSLVEGFYVTRNGYNLYLTKAYNTSDLETAGMGVALSLAANMGAASKAQPVANLQAQDLSYAVAADGTVSFQSNRLPQGYATAKLYPFGTINNAEDTDRGGVVVITIDLRTIGITEENDFAFEIGTNHKYQTVAKNGTIGAPVSYTLPASRTKLNTVDAKDCTTGINEAYEIKDASNKVVFYADPVITYNAHVWGTGENANTCTQCGATKYVFTNDEFVVEQGETKTLVTGSYDAVIDNRLKQEVENTDKSDAWWDGGLTAIAVPAENFIVEWSYKNTRDPYWRQDAVIEMTDGQGNYYDRNFLNNSHWGDGNLWSQVSATLTKNGTVVEDSKIADEIAQGDANAVDAEGNPAPAGPLEYGKWVGDYTITIIKVWHKYTLIEKFVGKDADGKALTYVFTTVYNGPVGRSLTTNITGNPYWVENFVYRADPIELDSELLEKLPNDANWVPPINVAPQAENKDLPQDSWEENDITIASAGYSVGKAWYLKKGQKLVVTGQITGIEDNEEKLENGDYVLGNWVGGGAIFDRILWKAGDAIPTNGRIDNWVNGGVAVWNVERIPTAVDAEGKPVQDWVLEMRKLRSHANTTVFTFDYTQEAKIVVTMQITGTEENEYKGHVFTQTYTITPGIGTVVGEEEYKLDDWVLVGITVDGNGFTGKAVATKPAPAAN